jgi:hypothetical protein
VENSIWLVKVDVEPEGLVGRRGEQWKFMGGGRSEGRSKKVEGNSDETKSKTVCTQLLFENGKLLQKRRLDLNL